MTQKNHLGGAQNAPCLAGAPWLPSSAGSWSETSDTKFVRWKHEVKIGKHIYYLYIYIYHWYACIGIHDYTCVCAKILEDTNIKILETRNSHQGCKSDRTLATPGMGLRGCADNIFHEFWRNPKWTFLSSANSQNHLPRLSSGPGFPSKFELA